MRRTEIEKLSTGAIGAKQEKLWNCHATWPDDFDDKEQNPHGRPRNYWCATVGGELIEWEGVSGWPTKEKALEAASKFQQKCVDWLTKHNARGKLHE